MTSAAAKLELQGLPDLLQWVDFGTCAVIFLPSCRWLIPLIGQINAPSSASLQVVLTEPCADTVLECASKYPLNNPKLQSAELVTMRPSAKPPFKRFADAFPFLSKDAGLVIFAGGMEAFDRLSAAQLNALLVNLANDASEGGKAVLLCLGGVSADLKQYFLNCRRAVSCAAAIEKQDDHFVWITNFWHTMDHYCDEVTLPLSFDADGRILIDSENNRGSSLERSDEDVVWSSVPSLQAESAGIPDLRTVADNNAVLAAGLRSAAATLVFRLDSAKDIEPVGRAIFTLRRRGGRLLKIAAVETKTPLRAASLAFLLGCGANIIFENTATCGYIRIMLASLKDTVYSHPLPEHFEEKLAAISASAVIGMVEPAMFLSAARSIISTPVDYQNSHGALIVLEPDPGILAEEAMDQFHPTRSGDMGCVMLNRAVLFLSGCRPSTLEITLRRIFSVDPTLIFQSYAGFFSDLEVANGLQQLEDFLERGKPSRRAYSRPITNRKPNPVTRLLRQNSCAPTPTGRNEFTRKRRPAMSELPPLNDLWMLILIAALVFIPIGMRLNEIAARIRRRAAWWCIRTTLRRGSSFEKFIRKNAQER